MVRDWTGVHRVRNKAAAGDGRATVIAVKRDSAGAVEEVLIAYDRGGKKVAVHPCVLEEVRENALA
jgi:hypothetical protein